MLRIGLVVTVLSAFSSFTTRAGAKPVAWLGAPCAGSKSRFESRLASLGKPGDLAQLSGAVTTTRQRQRLSMRLELVLADKPLPAREIAVKDCAEAADTAAVVAAMAAAEGQTPARPDSAETKPPGASSGQLQPEAEVTERASRPAPSTPPAVASERGLRAGLLAALVVGVLPSPAWGLTAELGLRSSRRWSLALLGSGTLAEEQVVPDPEFARRRIARLAVLGAVVRGCYSIWVGEALRVEACAGMEGLLIRGSGSGFEVDRSASLLLAAPQAALDVSLPAPRWLEWHAELAGSVPLTRPSFVAEQRPIAQARPLVVSARIGPLVRF